MALRSILDIDVKDEKFNEFLGKFQKYREELGSMGGDWEKTASSIGETSDNLNSVAAAVFVQTEYLSKMVETGRKSTEQTRQQASYWRVMVDGARNFGAHVKTTTADLIKWSGVTTAVAGLLGAGSLWGLTDIASAAAAGRRSALGLGLSYGEQASFGANFSRLVDPSGFLSAVNLATHDVSQRVGLYGAGLTDRDINGRSTAQVGTELIMQLKKIADQTPDQQLNQVLTARHLDQFVSLQDFERIKATSYGELGQLTRNFSGDQGLLGLDPKTQLAWANFNSQMSKAGAELETVFIKGLVGVAGPLEKMSHDVVNVVAAFGNSEGFKKSVDLIDQGIESFEKYLGSKEFSNDVQTFAGAMGKLADVVKWLNQPAPLASKILGFDNEKNTKRANIWGYQLPDWAQNVLGFDTSGPAAPQLPGSGLLSGGLRAGRGGTADGGGSTGRYDSGSISPDDLLGLVRKLEGSGDTAVSPTGAIGRYQIEPGTAEQYGADPSELYEPAYNKQVAKAILADLIKKYHGNVDEILAAYNGGQRRGNYLRDTGDQSGLPNETQGYLNRAAKMGITPGTVVKIENNTGGNTIITQNQLAN